MIAIPIGAARADDEAVRFLRPAAIEPQVRFWRAIFTEYSTHQVVLHDALRLDKVYGVLDFRRFLDDGMSEGAVERLQRVETDLELDRIRATLLRLHGLGSHPESLTPEEQKIWTLFADDPSPDRFLAAADEKRLRSQRGLKERFGDGIRVSRRYLPEMERIFREEGLPTELTRLPLVESCFNLRAYSKVGAAGIWQFMPRTGRRFMRVDNLVDERRDPIYSTHAAARFLSETYDALGSWPLAITAYNHGPEGVARAVDDVGSSDIARIIRDYRGPAFGFASRNFYAEFLAALEVEKNYREYFGDIPLDRPLPTRERRIDRPLTIHAAARLCGVHSDVVASLNPALSESILDGRRPIPRGCRLRLPEGDAAEFESRLAELSDEPEPPVKARPTRVASRAPSRSVPKRTVLTYRVQKGQTLSHIAKRYKVSVASLRTTNRLGKDAQIRPGQTIKIPRPA